MRYSFLLLFLTGCGASSYAPAYSTNDPKPASQMTYAEQRQRYDELGSKRYPSRQELQEFIKLDARLGVQEGQMSKQDFESWTHENY